MKKIVDAIPENCICVLGIPHDENSSFLKGPAKAPQKIRQAYFSNSSNLWSESGYDLGGLDSLCDMGDIDFSSEEKDFEQIICSADKILQKGNRLVTLGGDHAITYPVMAAHSNVHDNLTIFHLDAHPDLYDSLDGNRHSHACPFARIMEKKIATRLIQAGIRTMTGHQREQAGKFNVEVHEMKDGLSWLKTLEIQGPVYLSVDLDCLDPAFAPGVSHHEPGGLSTRQLLDIIQRLPGTIVGADIVEYNPKRDVNGVTAMVAAKLLKEIIDRIHQGLQ